MSANNNRIKRTKVVRRDKKRERQNTGSVFSFSASFFPYEIQCIASRVNQRARGDASRARLVARAHAAALNCIPRAAAHRTPAGACRHISRDISRAVVSGQTREGELPSCLHQAAPHGDAFCIMLITARCLHYVILDRFVYKSRTLVQFYIVLRVYQIKARLT